MTHGYSQHSRSHAISVRANSTTFRRRRLTFAFMAGYNRLVIHSNGAPAQPYSSVAQWQSIRLLTEGL